MNIQRKRSYRFNFWKDHIGKWKKSGLKQNMYCSKAGIDQQLFSKWKLRLSKKIDNKNRKSFIEINSSANIQPDISLPNNCYEILLPNGAAIRIRQPVELGVLSEIIKTVQAI